MWAGRALKPIAKPVLDGFSKGVQAAQPLVKQGLDKFGSLVVNLTDQASKRLIDRTFTVRSLPEPLGLYTKRVLKRQLDDPRYHGFPYSFDNLILKTTPIMKPKGYRLYQYPGYALGDNKLNKGVYELGVRIDGVINHRVFRPNGS
ncbi:hypothetical protein WH96_11300 [Kiloniella spongiae]|uniref:Uncharacterized protein n=2 Tax=Kiloniella spongiae TaxID=1489064 RepID=A0A0H2MJT7_9PROT|nr:hypothetical protein WH96_11300 [Kiloniella spongiae]